MTEKGRGARWWPSRTQTNSLLTQRKHRVQHVELPSLLSLSLLGEVLFLGRRLHEQPRLSTPYCSGNLKIFDLKIFPLKMKTKMKMGCFH